MEHFEKYESYIPFDLTNPRNFIIASLVLLAIVIFRYLLVAGLFWLAFYKNSSPAIKNRQIYATLPSRKNQLYEIKWSMYTSILFAVSGVLMGVMWQLGLTQLYLKFDQFGYWYLPVSLLVISIVHDFYFYWTHRWLHTPKIFKLFHSVHHNSITPSPWASFSFHPVEGLVQALALPVIILFIPAHPLALLIYLTFMTLSAVTNHLGFEILPRGSEQRLGKWIISGVHHGQHHRYYRYNFGLFYTFFDHLYSTEHPNFAKEYQQVFDKKAP
ncbi:MAG: sterol desaturase family protein [Bdellovibrionaceae bacterium]|nr:sterol desaturase family protein [Bdellovibrio sp.]